MGKCQPGYTCRRHSKPTCPEGCTCAKHSESHRQKMCEVANKSWQGVSEKDKHERMAQVRSHFGECQPGCQCGKHNDRQYEGPSYDVLHKRVYQTRGKARQAHIDAQTAAAQRLSGR